MGNKIEATHRKTKKHSNRDSRKRSRGQWDSRKEWPIKLNVIQKDLKGKAEYRLHELLQWWEVKKASKRLGEKLDLIQGMGQGYKHRKNEMNFKNGVKSKKTQKNKPSSD
jgi:hypothetical protein